MNEKINMFDTELKKKLPYLNDEEIAFLRQSLAGEVNKLKNILTLD